MAFFGILFLFILFIFNLLQILFLYLIFNLIYINFDLFFEIVENQTILQTLRFYLGEI